MGDLVMEKKTMSVKLMELKDNYAWEKMSDYVDILECFGNSPLQLWV